MEKKENKKKEKEKIKVITNQNEKGDIELWLEKNTKRSDTMIHVSVEASYEPEIPEYQGNYAQAVFLNSVQKASPIKKDSGYQRYLLYECGIINPSEYHQKMIQEGYLKEASFKDRVSALKVTDLKSILKKAGLATAGKKSDLIQRILDSGAEESIDIVPAEALFALSEKGEAFLTEYQDYVKLHQHKGWDISWQEYDAKKREGCSFNDTCWGIFNERLLHSYSMGRNEYYYMYQLLQEEKKDEKAFEFLLKILYLDISGVEGIDYLNLLREGRWDKTKVKECFGASIMLAPGIVESVERYKEYYSDKLIDDLYEWKLPVQICSKALFLELMHSIIDGSYDSEKATEKLQDAFDNYIDQIAPK